MTREEAITRVRKLFQLSGSENEHEAMLALSNAEKLMRKFSIEHSDITQESDITKRDFVSRYMKRWEQLIASSIAALFSCQVGSLTEYDQYGSRSSSSHFIGMRTNIQACEDVFSNLITWVNVKSSIQYPGTGRTRERNRYREGIAVGIWKRCSAIISERKKSPEGTALVPVERRIHEYMEGDYHTRYRNNSFRRTQATENGMKDASQAPIFQIVE